MIIDNIEEDEYPFLLHLLIKFMPSKMNFEIDEKDITTMDMIENNSKYENAVLEGFAQIKKGETIKGSEVGW